MISLLSVVARPGRPLAEPRDLPGAEECVLDPGQGKDIGITSYRL